MKNIVLSAALMFLTIYFAPFVGAAEVTPGFCDLPQGAQTSVCKDIEASSGTTTQKNPIFGSDGVITNATNLLSYAVGIVSVFAILYGAIRYIVSAGQAQTAEAAKNTILYAVIGLVVALIAQAIVILVLTNI